MRPTGSTRLGENPDRGVEAYDRRSSVERTWDVVETVRAVADDRGVSMAQVALAWLGDRPAVISVILGARTTAQLEDNLGAAGLHLSAEETTRLDTASDPGAADYPYGGPGTEQRSQTSGAARKRSAVTPVVAETRSAVVPFVAWARSRTEWLMMLGVDVCANSSAGRSWWRR